MSDLKKGSGGSKPTTPPTPEWPIFDPNPSRQFAQEVLKGAHAMGALVGRVAVWRWVANPSEHAYTKDVDIAVTREDLSKIRAWLAAHGSDTRELPIGGVNVQKQEEAINVDFITRSSELGDLSPLFEDAVREAQGRENVAQDGVETIPLVSAEHLVVMKLATMERKDEEDARRILEASQVDMNKVRQLISTFLGPGGTTRLEVFLRDIGHPAARMRRTYKGYSSDGI